MSMIKVDKLTFAYPSSYDNIFENVSFQIDTDWRRDSWSRPVYEANGRLYVDVNPVKDKAACICTKYQNDFDGEPDCHIRSDIEIEFSPCRDTW